MRYFWMILICIIALACGEENTATKKLPILGNRDFINGDTIYHKIPDFKFINQENQIITPQTFNDKYYVVDFFFTSCPTICPTVKKQTLRIYDEFKEDPSLLIISHSIDTKNDTVPVLKKYADALEVDHKKWHFVTGEKDHIYDLADQYFIAASVNPDAPGGFDHSGRLILVDKEKHVRAFCDGTDPEDVDRFILDIKKLKAE